jgi:hypothetical protein
MWIPSLRAVAENLLATWVADLFSPSGMTGLAIAFILALASLIRWHRGQRAAQKLGMASWYFIVPSIVVAITAIVVASYGLGLRAVGTTATTDHAGNQPPASSAPPVLRRSYGSQAAKANLEDDLDILSRTLGESGRSVISNCRILANFYIGPPPTDPTVASEFAQRISPIEHAIIAATASMKKLRVTIWGQLLNHGDVADDLRDAIGPEENFKKMESEFEGFVDAFHQLVLIQKKSDAEVATSAFRLAQRGRNIFFATVVEGMTKWIDQCNAVIDAKRKALSEVK